jgi:hypothetical protein
LQRLKKEVHKFLAQIGLELRKLPELSMGCLLRNLPAHDWAPGLKTVNLFPPKASGQGFLGRHHEVAVHS